MRRLETTREVTTYSTHRPLSENKGLIGRGYEVCKLRQERDRAKLFAEIVEYDAKAISIRYETLLKRELHQAMVEDKLDEFRFNKVERLQKLERASAEIDAIRGFTGIIREEKEADIRIKIAEAFLKELEGKREMIKMDLEQQIRKLKEKYYGDDQREHRSDRLF